MNYAIDHCEPFDGKKENIWMKAEHVGRYLFAVDFFRAAGARKIIDAACAEGFGSALLAEGGFSVYGTDINETYLRHAEKRCNGVFARCDLEREPFPAAFGGADGATCFETVEHLSFSRQKAQQVVFRRHEPIFAAEKTAFSVLQNVFHQNRSSSFIRSASCAMD